MTDHVPFPTGLSVAQARERIVELCKSHAMPIERIELAHGLGRVLSTDKVAPFDIPGFSNSAMDGFAVRGRDLPEAGEKVFRLIGAEVAEVFQLRCDVRSAGKRL